jgi:hypothetical protein
MASGEYGPIKDTPHGYELTIERVDSDASARMTQTIARNGTRERTSTCSWAARPPIAHAESTSQVQISGSIDLEPVRPPRHEPLPRWCGPLRQGNRNRCPTIDYPLPIRYPVDRCGEVFRDAILERRQDHHQALSVELLSANPGRALSTRRRLNRRLRPRSQRHANLASGGAHEILVKVRACAATDAGAGIGYGRGRHSRVGARRDIPAHGDLSFHLRDLSFG